MSCFQQRIVAVPAVAWLDDLQDRLPYLRRVDRVRSKAAGFARVVGFGFFVEFDNAGEAFERRKFVRRQKEGEHAHESTELRPSELYVKIRFKLTAAV